MTTLVGEYKNLNYDEGLITDFLMNASDKSSKFNDIIVFPTRSNFLCSTSHERVSAVVRNDRIAFDSGRKRRAAFMGLEGNRRNTQLPFK